MQAMLRDADLIPGSGRSLGGGHGNLLQYSCLENPMGRGAWWATVHRVARSQTRLKQLHTHTHTHTRTHTRTHTHLTQHSNSLKERVQWARTKKWLSPVSQFCMSWNITGLIAVHLMAKLLEPTHSNQTHKQLMYKPDNTEPMYSQSSLLSRWTYYFYLLSRISSTFSLVSTFKKMLESCSLNLRGNFIQSGE